MNQIGDLIGHRRQQLVVDVLFGHHSVQNSRGHPPDRPATLHDSLDLNATQGELQQSLTQRDLQLKLRLGHSGEHP